MNYLNTLVKNIEAVEKLNIYGKGTGGIKELTVSDIEKMGSDDNEKVIDKLDILRMSSDLLEVRYVLSSEALKEKVLNLNEEYLDLYKTFLYKLRVSEMVSADEFSKFHPGTLKTVYECVDGVAYATDRANISFVLGYAKDNNVYNNVELLTRVAKILENYSTFNSNDMKYDEELKNKVGFAINNSLDNLNYKSIGTLLSDDKIQVDYSYLSYISNHGISSIFDYGTSHLMPSLVENYDFVKRKELLEELELLMKEYEVFNRVLYIFETESFNNKEINTMLYKIKNQEGFSVDVFNSFKDILAFIYPNFKSEKTYTIKELQLYHYSLMNGKKKFLSVLNEAQDVCGQLDEISKKSVYRLLNLNSLTLDDIKKIENMNIAVRDKSLKCLYKSGFRNMSLKEFEFASSLDSSRRKIYQKLIDLRVDDRIRLVSDLPKIKRTLSNEEIQKVADLLREKSLSNKIADEYKKIERCKDKGISKYVWFDYFLIEGLDHMKNQVKSDLDVIFFVNYEKEIRNSLLQDFEETKKNIYLNSYVYEKFISELSASEEFLKDNEERIYEFFLSGMMSIFLKYHNSLRSSYRTNLIKITKAELSNKLKDIKFYEGDLAKEIGYDISKEQESIWKENIKFKGSKYIAEEADDYETILKLGAIPVDTCMHYDGGSYNYCLLSNFDANKKVLLGKTDNGTILGRAILRLTKISNTKNSASDKFVNDLAFRDVENLSGVSTAKKDEDKKEELVLFLERCYTSADDASSMRLDLLRLAYEKAKQLGVRLIVADDYSRSDKVSSFKGEMQAVSISYIYISKSKNGQQYLDSFSGSTSNDSAGYIRANGYKVFLQENMFDDTFERKLND